MKTRIIQRKNQIVKLCFILIVILGFKQTSYAQLPPNNICDGVLNFDGTNDYVNNGTVEHPNNQFTVEFWANISSSSQWIHILENGGIEEWFDCAYRIEIGNEGQLYFALGDGTAFVSSGSISTGWQYGEWNHYAFTFDGNTARVYLNGIEQHNFSTTVDITQGDGTLLFSSFKSTERYYDGKLDEVRIWDAVKTAPEILASMSTQLTGSETGLLGYWNFNDRSGATLTDASPNGNHGTLTNMDTLLNWVSEDGSAFNFRDVVMVCNGDSYTFPDGSTQNNITSQVVQTSTIVTGDGCDSIIVTTVNVIDISVDTNLSTLTANQSGATYQWLDCDNGDAPIPGEINQTFTAITTGNYAVEVTIGSCTNTSSCYFITGLGVDDVDLLKDITIYPNSTNNFITVTSSNLNNIEQVVLYDIRGRLIYQSKNITNNIIKIDLSTVTKGIYLLKVSRDSNSKVFKVIRN